MNGFSNSVPEDQNFWSQFVAAALSVFVFRLCNRKIVDYPARRMSVTVDKQKLIRESSFTPAKSYPSITKHKV